MKKIIVLAISVLLICVPLLVGCGQSTSNNEQTDTNQTQEEVSESTEDDDVENTNEYITEEGKFTKDVGTCLEIVNERMDEIDNDYHEIQDSPSIYVHSWDDEDEVETVISFGKSDGKTPVESTDEIPGSVFTMTEQPAGDISEHTIEAIVYVLKSLSADLDSDDSLNETVSGMASETEEMYDSTDGYGGLSKGTIGAFNVTMLAQDSDQGMEVFFYIMQE